MQRMFLLIVFALLVSTTGVARSTDFERTLNHAANQINARGRQADPFDPVVSSKTKERQIAENLAKDEELNHGWTSVLVVIHKVTLKPLHPLCVWFVEQVNQRFDEKQRKSIVSHIFWKLIAPWLALLITLQLVKVIFRRRFNAALWATTLMFVLFIAYDGGYSLTASFWSMMKIIAVFVGLFIFCSMRFGQSGGSSNAEPTTHSSCDSSSGNDGASSEGFTAVDTQGREYYGKGDTMYRDTPGDNGTFDRRNDGTWVSRYGDEVIREKGPGD